MKRCISVLDEVDAQLDKPVVIRNLPYCITLCLVSALVWTWSISWVPPLLGTRPTSPIGAFDFSVLPESSVVVACDSDRIEVIRFETHHAEASPMIKKALVEKVDVDIIDTLSSLTEQNSKESLKPLWEVVGKALDKDAEQHNIFIGLTTDFYRLSKRGKVNGFQLTLFEQVVRAYYQGSIVHFDQLTFDSQALLELNAVRFAYDPTTIFNNNHPPDSFSCDWNSCLLASGTIRPHNVIVIETDLKQALDMSASVGQASTLLWWEEHIRNNQILKQYGRREAYHGNLVAITMAAHAAQSVSDMHQIMFSVEDLLNSCSRYLEHVVLREETDISATPATQIQKHDEHYKKLVTALSIKRLMIILEELVDPTSLIYFQEPLNAADPLRIAWPLGAALSYPWDSPT